MDLNFSIERNTYADNYINFLGRIRSELLLTEEEHLSNENK